MTQPVCVAVINSNADCVEMLRMALENGGFVVVSAHLDEIKRGAVDLEQFIRQHRPAVVIYDVTPPYDRQWAFLSHMRRLPVLESIRFVLTSTNSDRLREIVGTDEKVYEIIGKPYDISDIVHAVKTSS